MRGIFGFVVLFFGSAFGGVLANSLPFSPISAALAALGVLTTISVSNPPAANGNWNNISTAFTGDLSRVAAPISHTISGASTLGQPASGYSYTYEAYPEVGYLYNTSGWNQSTSGNGGRTAAVFKHVHVYNHGQGDAVAFNFNCFVDTTRAGATSFLANPACSGLNGSSTAGANGVYLNPVEIDLNDAGFDAAGIGYVVNMTRTVNTASLGQMWGGLRVQSNGSAAVDYTVSATGALVYGVDLSGATFTGAPFAAPLITPASSSASCKQGSMEWDASFVYICVATNTWKRATLATF